MVITVPRLALTDTLLSEVMTSCLTKSPNNFVSVVSKNNNVKKEYCVEPATIVAMET